MEETTTSITRLKYKGDISSVINRLSSVYNIGNIIDFSVIEIGYEDCNIIINSSSGKYVAKIFSKERTQEDISRYSKIMEEAVKSGANHPKLLKTEKGDLVFSDIQADNISMVLMEFITGKTFLELNSCPNLKELGNIIRQTVKINNIDYKPPYIFDSWAIPNIKKVFEEIKKDLQKEDFELITKAINLYEEIPVDKLPHFFVHGDLTKANIIKGGNGEMYFLDFSVANWYPRIQELAVISANLLYDKNNYIALRDRVNLVVNEYEKFVSLTAEESKYLYNYALAGVVMEFMGAFKEKYIKGNLSEETDYWLNLGRGSLKRELVK